VLRLAERADLRLVGDETPELHPDDEKKLSLTERSRRMRERITDENAHSG